MKKLKSTNFNDLIIAVLGSHSALDVCRGAKDVSLKTLVICQKGREKTYQKYYKSRGPSTRPSILKSSGLKGSARSGRFERTQIGCVDEVIVLDDFKDILSDKIQKELIKRNSIFIPHRSFEVYINDYDAIEKKFKLPIFGNRFLLKLEERGVKPDQYDLLDKAGIRYPRQFKNPSDIDRLCIVKVLEKERKFERAFFLVDNKNDYYRLVDEKIKKGIFTKERIEAAVIEEFIIGVQVNFNFFYSPLDDRVELLGTDTRRQTNIEGLVKTPAPYQQLIMKRVGVKYEEAGHIAVTVLESLLEDVFSLGEKFVQASKKMVPPGVIGPFALQTVITPGPPKKEIIVFDVSPRMPGSPGISATPYGYYLYGEPMSMGKRVALEINKAVQKGELDKVLT